MAFIPLSCTEIQLRFFTVSGKATEMHSYQCSVPMVGGLSYACRGIYCFKSNRASEAVKTSCKATIFELNLIENDQETNEIH